MASHSRSTKSQKPDVRPQPRLMLVTPPIEAADQISAALALALDAGDVAAVVLRFGSADERGLVNAAKGLLPLVQRHDAALLLHDRADLVARSGADGAHLHGAASFETAVGDLKPDRIAGAGGLASRHDAMTAAEAGADYVLFGEPEGDTAPTPDDTLERIGWWAEVFEAPCVAYVTRREDITPFVAAGADFIALDDALWSGSPTEAIAGIMPLLRLPETVA